MIDEGFLHCYLKFIITQRFKNILKQPKPIPLTKQLKGQPKNQTEKRITYQKETIPRGRKYQIQR